MWDAIQNSEIEVRKPITQKLMQKVKDNFDYLFGKTSFDAGLLNGSFEIDSDNNGVPDNWEVSLFPGGQYGYEETIPAHGIRSFKFTHPGGAQNGGGWIESDYYYVAEVRTYIIGFILWSTVAGMKNFVHVRYFDKNKNIITENDPDPSFATLYASAEENNELIYRSISNPTGATFFIRSFKPPTASRYIKIRLVGGYTDTDVAGSTYFDNVALFPTPQMNISSPISEGSTSSPGLTDLGTVIINVPTLQDGFLQIDLIGEAKMNTGGESGHFRFRVGGFASNEYNIGTGTSYKKYPFRLLVPAAEIINSQITLYMQGYTDTGIDTIVAKKSTANTAITIISL